MRPRAANFVRLGQRRRTCASPLRFYPLDVSFPLHTYTLTGGAMADATERRTSRRFTMALPLILRLAESSGPVEKSSETRDVSFRGLYFWTAEELEPGVAIEFVLTLPKEITMTRDVKIHCFGRVIRVEGEQQTRGVAARIERYEFLPGSG
jgi:PilZ domain